MECSSVEWWCDLLRGLAHHRRGAPERAEEYYRRGLPGADPELACRLGGVGEILRGRDRSAYDALDCTSRTEFESRFWWLADPMFSMPGNDRWTEHISRRLELVLHEPILWVNRGRHPVAHEVPVVRRGQNDSWSRKPGQPQERWTGRRAARYRFAPASALVDGLRALSYPGPFRAGSRGLRTADRRVGRRRKHRHDHSEVPAGRMSVQDRRSPPSVLRGDYPRPATARYSTSSTWCPSSRIFSTIAATFSRPRLSIFISIPTLPTAMSPNARVCSMWSTLAPSMATTAVTSLR